MNWNTAKSGSSEPPKSLVPIVEVREIDSVLNTKSNDVIMLGGLMQDMSENNTSDNLFGIMKNPNLQNNLLNRNVTEIIILLKAKIVKNKKDYVTNKDKKLYNEYAKSGKQKNTTQSEKQENITTHKGENHEEKN